MKYFVTFLLFCQALLSYSQEARYDSLQNINKGNYTQLVGQTLYAPKGELVVRNLFWSNKSGKIYKPHPDWVLYPKYSIPDDVLNKHYLIEKIITKSTPLLKTRITETDEVVYINLDALLNYTTSPVMFVDGYIQKCKQLFLNRHLYMDKTKYMKSLPSSFNTKAPNLASFYCNNIRVTTTTSQNYGGLLLLSDRTTSSTPTEINIVDYQKSQVSKSKADEIIRQAEIKIEIENKEKAQRQQYADSIARKYETCEDPEWKSKAKIDQHYSTLLYNSDFPYVDFEKYDKSTRFLVRCNKRTETVMGHHPIKIKVQGGGRTNIADLNNCFVKFKSIRRGSISFTTNSQVRPQMTFETEDGTTLTFDCQTEADFIQLPYLFNVDAIELARIVLIGVRIWGTRETMFPYTPLTIIGVGIGKSTKYQHEVMVIDNQGKKHSIQTNLSLTNALTLEDDDNHFIDYYKFSDPEKAFPKIPKSDWNLIRQGRIRIGMSKDACTLSWGEPDDINTSRGRWGVHEQWVYPKNRYVYFENGKLSAIQD